MTQGTKVRTISFFLLSLFAYQAVGCYAVFFVWKNSLNDRVEQYSSTLSDSQLIKIKTESNDDEMKVKGMMLDVIRFGFIEGIRYAFCIRDIEEECMISTFIEDTFIQKSCEHFTHAIKSLQKSYSDFFNSEYIEFEIATISFINKYNSFYHFRSAPYCMMTATPPPECCI